MNPSGAPSLIERFTSLVSHVTGLDNLQNAVHHAIVNQNGSAPIPGHTNPDQGQHNQQAHGSANARLNYQLR